MAEHQTQDDGSEPSSEREEFVVEVAGGTIRTEVLANDREHAKERVIDEFTDKFLSASSNQAVCNTDIGELECSIVINDDELVAFPASKV